MEPPPDASPEPGERRLLDHPPSERYGSAATTAAEPAAGTANAATDKTLPLPLRERLLRGVAVGLAGAIALTVLGGPLSITAGLVGAAGAIGWVVGVVVRPGRGPAVGIALASVAIGLVGIWLYAGIEGGALGFVDYLGEVQGILVPIQLAVAGGLAAAAGG